MVARLMGVFLGGCCWVFRWLARKPPWPQDRRRRKCACLRQHRAARPGGARPARRNPRRRTSHGTTGSAHRRKDPIPPPCMSSGWPVPEWSGDPQVVEDDPHPVHIGMDPRGHFRDLRAALPGRHRLITIDPAGTWQAATRRGSPEVRAPSYEAAISLVALCRDIVAPLMPLPGRDEQTGRSCQTGAFPAVSGSSCGGPKRWIIRWAIWSRVWR